jgi:hypothetical protein
MELRFAYFSIIKGLFIYLTPFIPLSFEGEGEENKKEGLTPLLHALLC